MVSVLEGIKLYRLRLSRERMDVELGCGERCGASRVKSAILNLGLCFASLLSPWLLLLLTPPRDIEAKAAALFFNTTRFLGLLLRALLLLFAGRKAAVWAVAMTIMFLLPLLPRLLPGTSSNCQSGDAMLSVCTASGQRLGCDGVWRPNIWFLRFDVDAVDGGGAGGAGVRSGARCVRGV